MRARQAWSAFAAVVVLAGACGSGDGENGDGPLADAAENAPDDGGFELSVRFLAQTGDLAAFEGGGFTADGRWDGDDVVLDGGLDLAPAGAELTPAQEQAYRSDLEARLVGEALYVRSPAFGEEFVSADVPQLDPATAVAPGGATDGSGLWQPVDLLPLLAEATDVTELDRVDLDGTVATRLRAQVEGDLDAARAAVGLDPDGDGVAPVDAFVDEDGSVVRIEADVDGAFLIAQVVGPDVSAPATLRIDFVDPDDGAIEAPEGARDVTAALTG